MDESQTITTGERSYFALIPHMADDDLTVYEYRLYGHYRRVCGERSDRCTEKTTTTAAKLGMSKASVINTRRSLEAKGYIVLESQRVRNYERIHVILLDMWPQNMARYAATGHTENRYGSRSEPVQVTQRTGTGHVGNRHIEEEPLVKKNHLEEEPLAKQNDDADLRSSSPNSSRKITDPHETRVLTQATRTVQPSPINKHDAIRALLTSWLEEIFGYGAWDNWPDYLDSIQPHRLYQLARWFYRFRSRPAWGDKIDNPPGFITHQMETPGSVAGLSPAERNALHSYIDEADSIIRHIQLQETDQ
jgi:hypothetical protein